MAAWSTVDLGGLPIHLYRAAGVAVQIELNSRLAWVSIMLYKQHVPPTHRKTKRYLLTLWPSRALNVSKKSTAAVFVIHDDQMSKRPPVSFKRQCWLCAINLVASVRGKALLLISEMKIHIRSMHFHFPFKQWMPKNGTIFCSLNLENLHWAKSWWDFLPDNYINVENILLKITKYWQKHLLVAISRNNVN